MAPTTRYPLGAYLGNPNGSDPAAEAQFEADYTSFTTTMGVTPKFLVNYIDQAQPLNQWINNASWQAWSDAKSPDAKGMIPVIGMPMTSTADSSITPDQYFKNFAAGNYDSIIQGMVHVYSQDGYSTQYWRPGWEMNLSSMPSYALSSPQAEVDYVAAFQHIYTVLHAAGAVEGVNIQVLWNPSIINSNNGGSPLNTVYPGNHYVDVMGADVYSDVYPYGGSQIYDWDKSGQVYDSPHPVYDSSVAQFAADPINLAHYYTNPAATQYSADGSTGTSLSLQNLLEFAKANGKSVAIGETGAGNTGDGANLLDNPTFVNWLSTTLQNSGVPISFVNIWDSNGGGNFQFSYASDNKPLEAAAWARDFGAQATSIPAPISIGSGPDSVVLQVAEDYYLSDAQITVSVDGAQVGGVETLTASHAASANQTLTVNGNWGAGTHIVAVDFLNDLYAGTASTDRNAYVTGASYDGVVAQGASLALMSGGTQTLTVGTPTRVAPAVTLGTGSNTIDLKMSEDAYQGDGQFTVSVDGSQIGGTQTVTAWHSTNQEQDFLVRGNFGVGPHTVAIDFLNDLYAGSPNTDRNVYLDGATVDGAPQAGVQLALLGAGTQTFRAELPDTLALHVAEDAYLGDAQFTVSVDGKQLGGVCTATASHAEQKSQEFDFAGSWGPGSHTVSIDFLNDRYDGTPQTDRNLYVTGTSYNGKAQSGANLSLFSQGTQSFGVVSAVTSSTTYNEGAAGGVVTTHGNDTLTLGVSEDAYQGDAQYRVLVDGVDPGTTYTATASHAAGQINQQTISGTWGAGPHTVGVTFINDAWGGTPSLDRNLYINSVSYDGSQVAMAPTEQGANGTTSVSIATPSNLTLHLAEDAYQGDAQFAVTIDGQQVGQSASVSASHAQGASEAFSFTLAIAAGVHDVAVTFLNDAYGGAPWLDRSLYVTGADLNGTALNPSSWNASINANGAQHFSLLIPS